MAPDVTTHPRYQQASEQTRSTIHLFASALQREGFVLDPVFQRDGFTFRRDGQALRLDPKVEALRVRVGLKPAIAVPTNLVHAGNQPDWLVVPPEYRAEAVQYVSALVREWEASAKKRRSGKSPISETQWLEALRAEKGEEAALNAERLVEWFRGRGFTVAITVSQDSLSASLTNGEGKPIWPFFIRKSNGAVETALAYLQTTPAFASEDHRARLLERLKSLPEQTIRTVKLNGFPSVPLIEFSKPALWQGFTAIAEEVKARIAAP